MNIKNLKVLLGAFTLTSLVLIGCNLNNENNKSKVNTVESTNLEFDNQEEFEEVLNDLERRVDELDDKIDDLEDKRRNLDNEVVSLETERRELIIKIDTIIKENKHIEETNQLVANNMLLKNYDDVTDYIVLDDDMIKTEKEFNYVLDRIISNRKKIDVYYLDEIVKLRIWGFEHYSDTTKQKFNKFLLKLGHIDQFHAEGLMLSNISFLENTDIKFLKLSNNEINDLNILSSVKNMTFLELDGNKLDDISFLLQLSSLKSINLSRNSITDLSALSNLQYLTELALVKNNIGDITPLSSLDNLENLDLRYNNISDINALSELYKLCELLLDGNDINDISPILPLIEKNDVYMSVQGLNDKNIDAISSVEDEKDRIYTYKVKKK